MTVHPRHGKASRHPRAVLLGLMVTVLLATAMCGGSSYPPDPGLAGRLEIRDLEAPEIVLPEEEFELECHVADPIGVAGATVRLAGRETRVDARGGHYERIVVSLHEAEPGLHEIEVVARGIDDVVGPPARWIVSVVEERHAPFVTMSTSDLLDRVALWEKDGMTPQEAYARGPLYELPGGAIEIPDNGIWWETWHALGGPQPFDWDAHCPALPGVTLQGEVLRCWLALNPEVAENLVWDHLHLGTGAVVPAAYPNWSEQMKADLDQAFYYAWTWLASGLATPMVTPTDPSVNMIPPDATWTHTALNPHQAWVLYVATVAHSLALEIGGFVPWSVLGYEADDLRVLFWSRSLFRAIQFPYETLDGESHTYTGYRTYEVLPAFPSKTFRFFVDNDIVRPNHYATIVRLLGWSGMNMRHYEGGDIEGKSAMEVAYMHWQYYGMGPVARMLDGTVRDGWTTVRHWTRGCGGTSAFYGSILRALNIPSYVLSGNPGDDEPPLLRGHAVPLFATIGQSMSHADDILYWKQIKEHFHPPPLTLDPARMFVPWATFVEWFYNQPSRNNVARQYFVVCSDVLHDEMLDLYCDDMDAGLAPAESTIFEFFEGHLTLQELLDADLWLRLEGKTTLIGYCN